MRVGFDKANFASLADLWSRFYPAPYAVDADLLRLNTVDSPLFDWGASIILLDGTEPTAFVAIKKSAATLFRGPDPDTAHLSTIAYRSPADAVDLLAYAKRILVNRGLYRLTFGQDHRHFFPGCPEECGGLRDFLTVEGFTQGSDQVDLERDLADYQPPAGTLDPLDGMVTSVRSIRESDLDSLGRFFDREFPGRWRYDTFQKIAAEGRSDFVYGLFVDGEVEGFALTQDWTHAMPIAGGVWRADLGSEWGSLGPIGVSKRVRGRKLGDALLAASLAGLRDRGARRSIIDWTTLVDFYGKHGFDVTRRYQSFSLSLT